jgi:outer membrane biosynthesis protein TonB
MRPADDAHAHTHTHHAPRTTHQTRVYTCLDGRHLISPSLVHRAAHAQGMDASSFGSTGAETTEEAEEAEAEAEAEAEVEQEQEVEPEPEPEQVEVESEVEPEPEVEVEVEVEPEPEPEPEVEAEVEAAEAPAAPAAGARTLSGFAAGGAVQVDPQLESTRFQPLNLKCDILLSKFAFEFNLYRYIPPRATS